MAGQEELRRELKFLRATEARFVAALGEFGGSENSSRGKGSLSGYVRNRVKLIEEQFQFGQTTWSRERLFAALGSGGGGGGGGGESDDSVEAEMVELRQRLQEARQRRLATQDRRVVLAKRIHESRLLRDELQRRENFLSAQFAASVDELRATREDAASTALQLQKFSEISVINDAFYIWFAGPFATINNFRLGNSPVGRQVEWMEINAALGQAVLVVSIIAARAGLRFKQYTLHPYGSFSKVSKNDDRRILYNLFMDPTLFSLFPKSKFHPALFGFLCCVKELGDHISEHGE